MGNLTPAPPPECCNCKPRVARNMSYDTYERYVRDTRAEYEPTGPKSENDYNTWKALFRAWVKLSDSLTEVTPDPNATCYMTEIQLQAILDSKGDAEGELDVDMMTNAAGKRISKKF